MVVGSTDGSQESLGCVIYCFLMKFIDEKELVTDEPTDGRSDTPSSGDARTHLKTQVHVNLFPFIL